MKISWKDFVDWIQGKKKQKTVPTENQRLVSRIPEIKNTLPKRPEICIEIEPPLVLSGEISPELLPVSSKIVEIRVKNQGKKSPFQRHRGMPKNTRSQIYMKRVFSNTGPIEPPEEND